MILLAMSRSGILTSTWVTVMLHQSFKRLMKLTKVILMVKVPRSNFMLVRCSLSFNLENSIHGDWIMEKPRMDNYSCILMINSYWLVKVTS